MAQECATFASGRAMPVDLAGAEKRVRLALAQELRLSRARYSRRDGGRRLACRRRDQLAFARRGHFELEVDAIGERPRYAAAIAGDALRGAATAPAAVAAVAAGAGIHRRDELEARRELYLARSARDRHAAGFNRLA